VSGSGADGTGWRQHPAADLHLGFMWRGNTAAMKVPPALQVAFEWIAVIAVSAMLLLLVFAD
jgi:hypothetical protein